MSDEPQTTDKTTGADMSTNETIKDGNTERVQIGAPNSNENTTGGDQEGTPRTGEYHYGLFKAQMRFDPLSIVFALLIFVGGVIGYVNKGSSMSLISGTVFAILLAISTYLEGARKNPYPLLVTLAALGGLMLYRFSLSGVFMPSGLVALLAIIMLARHSYLIYLRRQAIN